MNTKIAILFIPFLFYNCYSNNFAAICDSTGDTIAIFNNSINNTAVFMKDNNDLILVDFSKYILKKDYNNFILNYSYKNRNSKVLVYSDTSLKSKWGLLYLSKRYEGPFYYYIGKKGGWVGGDSEERLKSELKIEFNENIIGIEIIGNITRSEARKLKLIKPDESVHKLK